MSVSMWIVIESYFPGSSLKKSDYFLGKSWGTVMDSIDMGDILCISSSILTIRLLNYIRKVFRALVVIYLKKHSFLYQCLYWGDSKLDETFPTAQFAIQAFNKPYRQYITSSSGGLLFYVKANLPSKLIRFYNFPNKIQCIWIKLNISDKKYALLSISTTESKY